MKTTEDALGDLAAQPNKPGDSEGNVVEGECVPVDTKNSTIVSTEKGHVVAVLGLDGIVVIQTPRATIVCPKSRLDEIGKLISEMKNVPGEK